MSYEPSEHEPNHGQVNHRFAGVSLPLAIATEPAVTAKPTKGALYNPASGQHFEDVKVGSFHDLNGAMPHSSDPIQQGPHVASVGPDMFDVSASLLAEETRDPQTGQERWAPAYNRAYTDGSGNYYLTDEQGNLPIENNPAWHQMQIINRNEAR